MVIFSGSKRAAALGGGEMGVRFWGFIGKLILGGCVLGFQRRFFYNNALSSVEFQIIFCIKSICRANFSPL